MTQGELTSGQRRMAAALAREAWQAVRAGAEVEFVAQALRPFLNAQLPYAYVMATRNLRKLRTSSEVYAALAQQRERRYQAALDLLRTTASSGEVLANALANGVRDTRAPERLKALAYLIGAYEELESRSHAHQDALRARLGLI